MLVAGEITCAQFPHEYEQPADGVNGVGLQASDERSERHVEDGESLPFDYAEEARLLEDVYVHQPSKEANYRVILVLPTSVVKLHMKAGPKTARGLS
eukprot:4297086-Pleurochrysis_carterae.AAC.1